MHLDKHPTLAMDSLTLPSPAASSLKDKKPVVDIVNCIIDTPKSIEMNPSMIQTKMDCQVSPGVLERRLLS
jgi:hypothetical protein